MTVARLIHQVLTDSEIRQALITGTLPSSDLDVAPEVVVVIIQIAEQFPGKMQFQHIVAALSGWDGALNESVPVL